MVPWYVLWIRTLIRITAVLKKLRGAIGMGRNNCNETDKCLHGGHRSGSEESVVCSEFERGGDLTVEGECWRMSSCLLSVQKEEMAFGAKETAWQISWRYGIAWHLGNTADSGYG